MLALSTGDRPIVEVEDQASKSTHDGVGGVVSLHQHPLTNATHLSECLCLLVCHGSFAVETILQGQVGDLGPPMDGSEIAHHLQDLAVVDAGAVPLHPVRGLPDVASDHALGHTAHELLPRGLAVATELYTRLGGIVEELIVLNPESDVPGFVVGPTVEIKSGVGHVVCLNFSHYRGKVRRLECYLVPVRCPSPHQSALAGQR